MNCDLFRESRRLPIAELRGSLFTMLLSSLLVYSCGGEEPIPDPVIRPVRYQEVFATGGTRERTFPGTSRASLESRLSFKVSGTVQRVAVEVGDKIKVKQLIAELDAKDYLLQVEDAEAGLKSAEAQSRKTNADYNRTRALYENRNASRNDLDAARARAESADAQVRSVQKKLELANSQHSYTRLTSPVDGAIASVTVEENENVAAGQPVALLTSGSLLDVEVAIPEFLIVQIRESDAVQISFNALGGRQFTGWVTEVGIAATGLATTFPVTVRMDHADPDCRPGMAAEVTFRFGSEDGRGHILIPAVAVGKDRHGRFVYVVEPSEAGSGTVRRSVVKVGDFSEAGFEILEGLVEGQLVVTASVSRIRDAQQVRLLPQ